MGRRTRRSPYCRRETGNVCTDIGGNPIKECAVDEGEYLSRLEPYGIPDCRT